MQSLRHFAVLDLFILCALYHLVQNTRCLIVQRVQAGVLPAFNFVQGGVPPPGKLQAGRMFRIQRRQGGVQPGHVLRVAQVERLQLIQRLRHFGVDVVQRAADQGDISSAVMGGQTFKANPHLRYAALEIACRRHHLEGVVRYDLHMSGELVGAPQGHYQVDQHQDDEACGADSA